MDKEKNSRAVTTATPSNKVVERSVVPPGKPYGEYREYLRYDFFYSCAYCTMNEAEAQGIRFTIDHYTSQNADPTLVNEYSNLMYACDPCNGRKGDRTPPASATAAGYRFFRADHDLQSEHFLVEGVRVKHKTNVGEYTIEALDLNRLTLRRIREFRQRFEACVPLVEEGVRGLREFPYDQLPMGIRGQALKAINKARSAEETMSEKIDALLRAFAQSPILEPEVGPEYNQRLADRRENLSRIEGLYPGKWRAPRASDKK